MATAKIEVLLGVTGLTLTVDVYPIGSDTAAFSAVNLTEETNRRGLYSGTVSNPTAGMHQCFIKNATIITATGVVYLTNDTSIHRILDEAAALAVQDVTGNIPSIPAGTSGGLPTVNASNQVNIAPQQIVVKKNVAFNNFPIFMNIAKQPTYGKSGITWNTGDATVSIDGVDFVNLTHLPTSIGSGLYNLNLAAGDLNGNAVTLKFVSAGADTRIISILTQP